MTNREKKDTPAWALSVTETVQLLQNYFPVNALIKAVAGSNSPAYRQAWWLTASEVVDELGYAIELPLAEADPEASAATSVSPRLKNKAVVVGSGRLAINEILFDRRLARPAIAYTYKNKTHAGVLRGDLEVFGRLTNEYTSSHQYTAALRTGRNDFGAAVGVWVPNERVVIVPGDANILDQNLPVKDLPEAYPGTPLT